MDEELRDDNEYEEKDYLQAEFKDIKRSTKVRDPIEEAKKYVNTIINSTVETLINNEDEKVRQTIKTNVRKIIDRVHEKDKNLRFRDPIAYGCVIFIYASSNGFKEYPTIKSKFKGTFIYRKSLDDETSTTKEFNLNVMNSVNNKYAPAYYDRYTTLLMSVIVK